MFLTPKNCFLGSTPCIPEVLRLNSPLLFREELLGPFTTFQQTFCKLEFLESCQSPRHTDSRCKTYCHAICFCLLRIAFGLDEITILKGSYALQ